MWWGHYESEVKQHDLNKTKLLNIKKNIHLVRMHNRSVVGTL